MSRQAQNGRDSMYVEALKARSSSRKLVRARVCLFLCPPPHPAPPNRHLWIGYRSYETGLRDPGFPPFLSENVMLMFAYVYVVCFHGVVHCHQNADASVKSWSSSSASF